MAASFPTSLPTIQRVAATDRRNAPGKEGHALHNKIADEVEALAAAVGVTGSVVPGTVEKRLADVQGGVSGLATTFAAHVVSTAPHRPSSIISSSDVDARPPRLWPADALALQTYCADDDYAYGNSATTHAVVRVDLVSHQSETVHSFGASYAISDMFASSSVVFAVVLEIATSQYVLYRSVNHGVSFTEVHQIGLSQSGLVHSPEIKILMRGMDFGEVNGLPTIVFGTYNIASAAPGTDADINYLASSTDNGATWTRINLWNVSGTQTIDHIHAVRWDQYREVWWIAFGDDPDHLGMVRWDGVTAWPGNRPVSEIGTYEGFIALSGPSRYRVVDIMVTAGWIYTFTDTIGETESGIWRCTPGMEEFHRVDNSLNGVPHDGWASLVCGDGTLLWCDDCRADATDPEDRYMAIYASADGNRWWDVGHVALTGTGVKIARGFFWANNSVWFSCDGVAGKGVGTMSTVIMALGDTFCEERPDNLAPTYFVDFVAGNDSNTGHSQAAAWKTARHPFSGNKLTPGARVILSAGTSTENGLDTIDYAANANPATDTARHVQMTGAGRDQTTVVLSGAINGWRDLSASKTWNIELGSLTLQQSVATGALLWDTASMVTPATWTLRDATIGDLVTGSSHCLYIRSSNVKAVRSILAQIASSTKYCIYADGVAQVTCEASQVLGGRCLQRATSKITLVQCEVSGYANTGLSIDSTASVAPKVINCIFSESTQTPIVNSSGSVTLSASDISGCYYGKSVAAAVPPPVFQVAGAVDRHPVTKLPYPWSSLLDRLDPSSVVWDFHKRPFLARPACGAVERQ